MALHIRRQVSSLTHKLLQPLSQFSSLRFAGGNPETEIKEYCSDLSGISELKPAGASSMLIYFLELSVLLTTTVYFNIQF